MSSRVIFASCIIAAVQSVRINESEMIDPVEKVLDVFLPPVELPEEENDCCQPFDFCCDDEMQYDDWVIAAEITDKIADEIAQEIADEEDLTVEETLEVKEEITADVLEQMEDAIEDDPSLADELPEVLDSDSDVEDIVADTATPEYKEEILEQADVDSASESEYEEEEVSEPVT